MPTKEKITLSSELENKLNKLKIKVDYLQAHPKEFPSPEKIDEKIKVVPLSGGKGHYWEMDRELMMELYPSGWLHKAEICINAALGHPQQIVILGAQTAKRDLLEPAKWVYEHLNESQRNNMRDNLVIDCLDILGPPPNNPGWVNGILNVSFATGRYETKSIEEFIDNYSGKDIHLIAEGCIDYLSSETQMGLLKLLDKGVKSMTLRTIIPLVKNDQDIQYVSVDFLRFVKSSLARDFCISNLGENTQTPPVANNIEEIIDNAWIQEFSDEQKMKRGLDINYPGRHPRPQDIVNTFKLLGKTVKYNLFSTIGGDPNGASITISN